ncbi:hypothetical protein AB0L40_24525 [Patulibacter sp. NPDC049589]|uniref:hypothetical protein n=1 Tax=Patulibacter sp. NPDC049589 TaxID=3154731 RepID=UPI003429F032
MSTPPEQQPQGTTDPTSANMVRVCDRCGTVCAADQEWCLNCGVRMTETSQRLPGLRAASLVVALAVLLAGGAAAASYAALRGDARSAANVPAATTGAPVAQAPVTTAPAAPVAPVAPPVTTTPTTPSTTTKTTTPPPATPPASSGSGTSDATPDSGSSGSGSSGSGSSGSGSSGSSGSGSSGSGSSGSGSSGSGSSGSGSGSTTTTDDTPSGPITFAAGQGSIYDPDSLATDTGEEKNAIDGNAKTAWTITLKDGSTGGLGYVLDFDDATTLKTLTIATGTAGVKVKILGTSKSALPPDVLDNGWDTIASETTLKDGKNKVPLKAVSGAKTKYRHVLVLFTVVPGTPASAEIDEFTAAR